MLGNYLVVAYRNFRRHAGFGLLTVAGLAVGIASCLFILLFVQDELSYDRMFEDADRIYRVVEARAQGDGGEQHFVYTAGPLAEAFESSLPEIESAAGVIAGGSLGRRTISRGDTRFYVGDHLYAGPDFLEMFDFEFVRGKPEGAIDEPLEVVLTQEAALRYFGDEDPMGEILSVEALGDVTVTGVLKRPENSHFGFSMIVSYASLMQYEGLAEWLSTWKSTTTLTFAKLTPGSNPDRVERKVLELALSNFDEEDAARRRLYLQALTEIHLGSGHIQFDLNRKPGRMAYVFIFSAVALFILLIACVNYMNMATACAVGRAREIGMRKVVGAGRRQLIGQFLSESLLTSVVAFIAALGIVAALLSWFNSLAGKAVAFSTLLDGMLLPACFALVLLVGLLAGSYPALYLSRFRPSAVLKGAVKTGRGAAAVRRGLVVGQFVLSIFLISATLIVHDQLGYFQGKPLGFEEDQLLVIDINDGSVRRDFEAVKAEMAKAAGVRSVSVSNRVPGDWKNIPEVDVHGKGVSDDEVVAARFLGVDEDFLDTYRIELVDGVGFSGNRAIDSTSVLINETASRMLSVDVGDLVVLPESDFEARIVGKVGDFHFRPLHEEIGPMILAYWSNPVDVIDYFTVRFGGQDLQSTMAELRAIGERFDPEHPFEYNFLDARLAEYYSNEQRVSRVFAAAAMIAIVLACLGLFGLAAYVAEQRTKEIGVRKVLGATSAGIVRMLTSEFARLVLIAFVIAAPLAYVVMEWWLREFPYRVAVSPGTLALAGCAALAAALLTVGYQALKAALTNPAECLQYE